MASALFKDDNGVSLVDPAGLRPVFSAAGQKEATTSGSIAEVDISALNVVGNRAEHKDMIIMVVCITNPCYFSLGAASAAPSDTTTMMLIPAGVPIYMRAKAEDVSAYTKQITGAGTLHISVHA